MEDNYERLGDFIRKKLEAPLPADEDWDMPDPSVWSQAKTGMTLGGASTLAGGLQTWVWTLGVVSVLSLGFAAWTYLDVRSIRKQWQASEEVVVQLNHQLTQQQQTFSREMRKVLAAQDSLYHAVKEIQQHPVSRSGATLPDLPKSEQAISIHSQTSALSKTHLDSYNPIRKSNQSGAKEAFDSPTSPQHTSSLTPSLHLQPASTTRQITQAISTLPGRSYKGFAPQLPTSTVSSIQAKKIRNLPNHSTSSPLPPLPSFGADWQVELGAEVGMVSLDFASNQKLRRLYTVREEIKQTGNSAIRQGLNIGFSPNGKWWIRTGIGTMRTTFEQEGLMTLTYNKNGEYQNARGLTVNDLNLIQTSPYRTSNSTISINLPSGRQVEEGELVDLYFQESQGMRAIQIPLELAYIGGNGALQWTALAGAQWNQWVFEPTILSSSVVSKSRELPLSRDRELRKPIPAKDFISTYGGIGLSYELLPNWYLRPELTYNVHFLRTPKGFLRRTTASDRTFNVSVHYRF